MKKLFLFLFAVMFCLGFVAPANALLIEHNYSEGLTGNLIVVSEPVSTSNYIRVFAPATALPLSQSLHELQDAFTLNYSAITSARLTLMHRYGNNQPLEAWVVTANGALSLGPLTSAIGSSAWIEQDFVLSAAVISEMLSDQELTFLIRDTDATYAGMVQVAGAELEVVGTPVPEPASMLLLGFGLAGLAGMRRKKK